MDYGLHYDRLLAKYGRVDKPVHYAERHHILPKCLGGTNDPVNLIYLTPRCHLLAHWLLMREFNNPRLNIAFATMCTRDGIRLTPKLYEIARKAVSGANSPVARPVVTPLGNFVTVRLAAKAHGVGTAIISKKAASNSILHKGYYYPDAPKRGDEPSRHGKHLVRPVRTPLGIFGSTREAGIAHGICHSTIAKRARRGDVGYRYL